MKNLKNIMITGLSAIAILSLSGCSTENPFGVGYEHSACEASSSFGVCGSPEDIYNNRDVIRKTQNDYLKSGLDTELFFGIGHNGKMIVKDGRTEKWQEYDKSEWAKEINARVYPSSSNKSTRSNATSDKLDYYSVDTPVTNGTDLSVKYKSQGRILQTRTNVGDMIRDSGLIQRIWIAPVVDRRGDLISAHEIYAVIHEPKWIIGERTPKATKKRMKNLPTPISKNMLGKQNRIDKNEELIMQDYNSGNSGALLHDIENDPRKEKVRRTNMTEINSFIKE